jgi:hypothetical protein
MKNDTLRHYSYVGPEHLKRLVSSPSTSITTPDELQNALESLHIDAREEENTATFVIDLQGHLRLAYRHSEHVCCAGGEDVLSAGEITFGVSRENIAIKWITNQSTGYCPEPESWLAVERSLRQLNVNTPNEFSMAFVFRRCEACSQINVVKDSHFECAVCGAELPRKWNFG